MEPAYYIGALFTSILFLPIVWLGLWSFIRYDDRGHVTGGAAIVTVSASLFTVPIVIVAMVIWPLACLFGLAYWWDFAWDKYCHRGEEDE